MVKVYVAPKLHDVESKLGQFAEESDFDILVEEDMDVYLPADCDLTQKVECNTDCSACPTGANEDRIAFKFRKNYFTEEEQRLAYEGLREAATETQNRGIAAGPRQGKLGNREWVTEYEYAILDYFQNPTENLFGEDPIEEIRRKHQSKAEPSNRSNVWSIERTKKDGFNFDEWVEVTRNLSASEQKKEAKRVIDLYVCKTTYANSVFSGICGWFDRYPRIPYGRATAYTEKRFDDFKKSYPFLQHLAEGFAELLPNRYSAQRAAADKIDQKFLVPETPFTTITVNKTFRTAYHRDAGDLTEGLSNLLVLSNNGNYKGGYLVFPQIRMAVNVRPGDLLLVNNHEVIHGNTEIELLDENAERVSLVCYFREKMLELGSYDYELTRKNFVDSRRKNPDHPLQRPLWNGVSAGMWESEEWYEYLTSQPNGEEMCKEYDKSLWDKFNQVNLEDFFG